MEKVEIVKLNDKEYELVLNRESFVRIDRICDVAKSLTVGTTPAYDIVEDITDDYNPMEDISFDSIAQEEANKLETLKQLICKTFFILLYPKNQLKISEVKEMLEPYFNDSEKLQEISELTGELLQKCVEIKEVATKEFEEKNLKSLAKK